MVAAQSPPLLADEAKDDTPEYSLRLLWPTSRYLLDKQGPTALAEVAATAGLPVSAFDDGRRWVSGKRFEMVLAAARARLSSDDEFIEACSYRMAEVYGPFRFISWGTSPALVYRGSEKASRFCSSVGAFHVDETGPTHARVRWTCSRREGRLTCLSRQAQCMVVPTLWGLPGATVTERSCIARGDGCCDYLFQWHAKRRIVPVTLAGMLGALAVRAMPSFGGLGPLLGGIAAASSVLLYEYARADRLNSSRQQEAAAALSAILAEEAEARAEIELLHARQREWNAMLEEAAATRAEHTREVVAMLTAEHHARTEQLRGVTHDVKGPLNVIVTAAECLRASPDPESIEEIQRAAFRISDLVNELLTASTHPPALAGARFEEASVADIAGAMDRRLRALARAKPLRTQVKLGTDAPPFVETDALRLDRIIDNLLTNAIKYTEAGEVCVEIRGDRDTLIVRVSDTGPGFDPGELTRSLDADGSDVARRAPGSHGLGLSVVVDLLTQLGGTLTVDSQRGVGSTFTVRLPTKRRPSVSINAR